jgi:hypothetical protein
MLTNGFVFRQGAQNRAPVKSGPWAGWCAGYQPDLLVKVQAEMTADIITICQFCGQIFLMPTVDSLIPPASPFHNWEPVEGLEIHDGVETLSGRHHAIMSSDHSH